MDVQFARLGQLAIAARFRCQIHDDAARLHGFNQISVQ
jgi:hypothetical protein